MLTIFSAILIFPSRVNLRGSSKFPRSHGEGEGGMAREAWRGRHGEGERDKEGEKEGRRVEI